MAAVVLALVIGIIGAGLAGWAAWAFLGNDGGNGDGRTAPPPEPSATSAAPDYPEELARFYEQDLDWRKCGPHECSRLDVPLDYAEPDGDVIELAVLRVPAKRRDERVGQLVVNPGGPGASAVNYAASGSISFGTKLARYFDIVGVDPRGVGKSTTLECAGTEQTDEFLSADPDPDTPEEVSRLDRLTRELGEGCLSRSGDLARHISTVEVAKDMDILRAALGERQLDYLGASYGTFIGATYADLFPKHVRRMVLDGAIDPSLSQPRSWTSGRPRASRPPCAPTSRTVWRRAAASWGRPSTRERGGSASCSTTSTPGRCRPPRTVSSPRGWRPTGSSCRSTSRSTGRC